MRQIRILAAVVLIACFGGAAGAGRDELPRLGGTFIQLWQEHRGWTPQDWDRFFGYLKRLHLSQFVIQWSVYDEFRFYSYTGEPSPAKPGAVENLLDRADAAGIKVWVGLSYNSSYWKTVTMDTLLVQVFLQRMRLQAFKTAEELMPLISRHRSFAGWYICEEVDDITWNEVGKRELLIEHLQDLSRGLSRRTPGKSIAVSGFSNARLSVDNLAAFWGRIFSSTTLSQVFFQDGIGTRKIALSELPEYLGALHVAAERNQRKLCVTIETFQQENEESSGSAFHAVPAPLNRLQSQMTIAKRFSHCGLMAFSVPEYMSPAGGSAAVALYEMYCKLHGY